MTAQEYEQFLHDAEIKLARLKALYEQWFQGIERTEPVIVRKDLDRSLELLKKNMPRNTALRFRTQQLSARYGTYSIYWARIGRQIEEGTYKRILARVSRNSAPSAAAPKAEESGWEIEVDIDETESGSTGVGVDFSEGDLDAILGALTTEEKPKSKTTRSLSPFGFGAGMAPSRPPAGASVAATFGKPVDSGVRPGAPAPVTGTLAKPSDSGAPPKTGAGGAPTPASTRATPLVPSAPSSAPASVPKVSVPKVSVPKVAAPAPVPPPSGVRPAAPSIPRPAVPVPVSRPPAPAVARPSGPSGVRPAPSVDVSRPAPAPPVVAPRPLAASPPPSTSLDEGRMRAIHASYVDARRKNNEGADVRYETLAESVAKMIPKLREKHGGKAIDFEVVLQNGKVGLKPKVSG